MHELIEQVQKVAIYAFILGIFTLSRRSFLRHLWWISLMVLVISMLAETYWLDITTLLGNLFTKAFWGLVVILLVWILCKLIKEIIFGKRM